METKWARYAMRMLGWIALTTPALPAFATEKKITVQGVIRRTGSTGTDALVNNSSASITLTLNHCTAGYTGSPDACPGYSVSNSNLDSADTTAVIKNGAFSVSLTPKSNVVADMAKFRGDDWYVVISGELDPFASGSTSKFPIRIEGVPFAAVASTAVNAISADGLNGITVDTTGITDGQLLKWDSTSNKFLPGDDNLGVGGVSGGVSYVAGSGINLLGGVTIAVDSTKVVTLTSGKISTSVIPTGTGSGQIPILDGSGKLATAVLPTITNALLGVTSVSSTNLTANSINTAHIADDQITTAKIADSQVTDAKIVSVSGTKVTGSLSAVTSVTTTNLKVNGLTASKIVFTDGSKNLVSSTANVSDTQLGYLAGVTSDLQTQINNVVSGGSFVAKAGDTMTGTLRAPTVNVTGLTASKLVLTDGSKNLSSSTAAVTDTQLGYLAGVTADTLKFTNLLTSDAQTQINSITTSVAAKVSKAGDTMTGTLQAPTIASTGSLSGATIQSSSLTASKLVFTDGSKNLTSSTAAVTDTQLNYLAGVTGDIQTQINGVVSGGSFVAKAGDTMTGTLRAPTVNVTGLTASKLVLTDGSKNLSSSTAAVTDTQLGYLAGVTADTLKFTNLLTSDAQTQINSITTSVAAKVSKAGDTMTGTLQAPTVNVSGLTASKLIFTDGSKNLSSATSAVTDTELGYLVGVTSPIQTQINNAVTGAGFVAKAGDTMTGTLAAPTISVSGSLSGATIQSSSLTASRIVLSDGSKNLSSATSAVTDTQLGYLAGVTTDTLKYMNGATGNVQTQINALAGGTGLTDHSVTTIKLDNTTNSEAVAFSVLRKTNGTDETSTSSPDNSERVVASRTYGAGSYTNSGTDKTINVITRIAPSIVHNDCGVVDTGSAGSDNIVCAGF